MFWRDRVFRDWGASTPGVIAADTRDGDVGREAVGLFPIPGGRIFVAALKHLAAALILRGGSLAPA
jgi:hypothetical protein